MSHSTPRLPFPNIDILTLDKEQERYAKSLGSGHRLIYGVAGSGKTVTLLARAQFASEQKPEGRVLILCYNVALAACIRNQAKNWHGVEACHFDEWSQTFGVQRAHEESDGGFGERLLHAIQRRGESARRYDAVLIDEAQDFAPEWFRCVVATMKDPEDGDLLIVSDANQGVYRRRKESWISLGIHASGRRTVKMTPGRFDSNYRNTREIMELARRFTAATSTGDDEHDPVPPDPAKCSRSIRMKPVLYGESHRSAECKRACKIVKNLLSGTWNGHALPSPLLPSEIAILYPMLTGPMESELGKLIDDLKELAPVIWVSDKKARENRGKVGEEGIKIQTIHSAKGLEYRAVIVLWADLLPNEFFEKDWARDRILMYVAITRAMDFLGMTYSKGSQFITEIVRSNAIEPAKWN